MLWACDGPVEYEIRILKTKISDLTLSSQTYFSPSINKFGAQNANLRHGFIASSS